MAPIDDKIVAMSFESSKFESGVNKTLSSLDKLKASLKFDGAGKGFDDLNRAAQGVQLGHIGQGVDSIKSKLESMKLVAIGVMTHIANLAVDTGARFVKSFALDPIKAGFQEYATNLNAVQTILANTQASGATLKDVNAALLDLNKYSDKTIYNFSQMAKNIGTFTAAGVDLDTSTQAIKGIANLAALSGSNADQAATAMYQLSQAISAGRVGLQDWNSVVNAGMGGTVFQRALAQTAVTMGTLKENSLKLVGPMKNVAINGESFRQSIGGPGPKWLTSKVLTQTLKQFTGDLTNAQLAAMGFNDAQIKAIQQTAKTAQHAATEVKTIKQVLDVAKETAGSGWAQTWQLIFGNFGEAKTTFTALSNAINGFINKSAEARNKVLGDWKALGGRTILINSIKTAFHNLGLILKPIKEAFRDIFPATTGKNLLDLTMKFKAFADALKPSEETVNNLKRTFRGLFALLDIGKQIIGGIFTVLGSLFGSLGEGSGGFLNFTGNIGDFLVKVDEALKKGDRLHNFFAKLGAVLAAPVELIKAIGHALSDMFSGFSPGGFSKQIGGITKAMSPFEKITTVVSAAWDKFINSIRNSGHVLKPAIDAIVSVFSGFGPAVGDAFSNINFDTILQAIRTGLFATLIVMLKNFFGRGSFLKQLSGLGGGFVKNMSSMFNSLTGSMKAMQHNIQADTLKKIAIAIALLTVSIVALSFVDAERLKKSIVAMGFMFAELLAAMKILDKIGTGAGFIKLPFIAASLILLAGAIDLLTISVIALSKLSWNDLLKGLAGVGFFLVGISAAAIPLSANSSGMIRAGLGMIGIAVALKILASAVKDFSQMSWREMGKGLVGIAAGLGILVAGVQALPGGLVLKGVGLIAIAFALKLLASAVERFSGMDWKTMGKGMAGIAGALVIVAGAMQLMPKNMILMGAGLLLVSAALKGIANAVTKFGGMSIEQIAKGLGTLAGALAILAAALYVMSGTMAGAIALGIAAAGLALLAPALTALGKQSWMQILKGLITLAAALTILGVAGLLLTPVIPSLLGLGAALILIGGGLALAGVGIALIGVGLSALVVAAPTGVGILIAALEELVAAIPRIAKDTALGLLEIVKALANTAPQFVDAVLKIINSLLDAVIKAAPKIGEVFNVLMTTALQIIHDNQGKILQAGFDLLIALLNGIRNNIGQVVTSVVGIITALLGSIGNNLGKIITAGAQVLVSLLKGIANNIATVTTAAINIITRLVGAIASNLGLVVTAGLSILTKLLGAIAGRISDVIRMGTNIIVNFVTGIGNAGARIVTAAVSAITKFINAIVKGALKLVDVGATAIVNFLNGVATAINTHAPEMRAAGGRIGLAIADGMSFGLASKAASLAQKAADLGHGALSAIRRAVGSKSPSTEAFTIGQFLVAGLANGMSDNKLALASANNLGHSVITMFKDVFQITSPSKVMQDIGKEVGRGFADGIRGSTDDIKGAFQHLNDNLTEAMTKARETIASEQDKLDKLRAAKKPDTAAIKEAQKIISENEDILRRSTAGHIALVKTLNDEKQELIGLVKEYEKISDKLKEAQSALDDARKVQEDAIRGFTSQFSTAPDISELLVKDIKSARETISAEQKKYDKMVSEGKSDEEALNNAKASIVSAQDTLNTLLTGKTLDASGNAVDQLATYMEALRHQTDAVGAYAATLEQLRKLGLDDATYQKLLKEGTADQSFANQLLSGGKTAVDSLNTLDRQLFDVSSKLAVNAGNNLYQAGVDAADGLVKGLESRKTKIRKTMEEIAREILQTLKRELKIKSPSEEFAQIGKFAMAGMALGFSNSSKLVTDAVDAAAQDALTAMQRSMRDISDVVTNELDTNPVITPILDLTQIQSQSQELSALTNVPITAAASFGQASLISSERNAIQSEEIPVGPGATSVKFEQNNYSPTALTDVEIYRQTRNQLSQLKSVLAH